MRWRVRAKKNKLWDVLWQHRAESSSWWSDEIVSADSAEEAARKMLGYIDVDKHTRVGERRVKMRVYGPIPEEFTEFMVGEEVRVDAT